jgi:hypothetical protein
VLALLAPSAQAGWRSLPLVPKVHGASERAVVKVARRGQRFGNRADAFAKVGDSISQSPAFLQPLGCERARLAAHRGLRPAIRSFARRALPGSSSFCRRSNSMSRNSAATLSFTPSAWPLTPGASPDQACSPAESPLGCEIRLDRPAYAVILFGTNDVNIALLSGGNPLEAFLANMTQIVAVARGLGVVPILSTIPPRADRADAEPMTEELNAGLQRLAADLHVPLINLWRALDPLPNHGMSSDGIHPSLFGGPQCIGYCNPRSCAPACQAGNFSENGLRYGYNMRNLITMKTLSRLSRIAREHLRRPHAGG